MHRRPLFAVGLVVLVLAAFSTTALPEGEDDDGGMAGWTALGTPGAEHEWLAGFAGDWTVEGRLYQGPGEPIQSKATAHIETIWGGRYAVMDFEGEFMGQPFQGRGTWAYDNGAKQYRGSWIDSGSTALAVSTGTRDGDVLTMKGSSHTPLGLTAMRDVVKREEADRWTMTSYWTPPGGTESKIMEMIYTRVPSGD